MNKRRALGIASLGIILVVSCAPSDAGSPSGQTRIKDYEEARSLFWRKLYNNGGSTLYCGRRFGAGYNPGINVEHVFPMSWVTNALKCGRRKECRKTSEAFNRIEADLHNLYPARTDVNDARSAMRFGEVPGERKWSGGCDFEVDEKRWVVEPAPASRGEIARAMFYMQDTYGLEIFKKQGMMLKQWHRDDPVSPHERQRNDAIEKIQGTRNKYIDHPELVDSIRF